jgi:hypothetical protein
MRIIAFSPRLDTPEEAVQKFCARTLKVPYSVELLYLPFVMFGYSVEMTRYSGRAKTFEGMFLADLVRGVPMNIRKKTAFRVARELKTELAGFMRLLAPGGEGQKDVVMIESRDIPNTQVLPAVLEQDEAMARAKNVYRYDIIRLAGGWRFRNLDIRLHPETKVVHYPFWLLYHRTRSGEMTFGVIDGVSGQKEGGELAASIKFALVAKKADSPKHKIIRGEKFL